MDARPGPAIPDRLVAATDSNGRVPAVCPDAHDLVGTPVLTRAEGA